MSKKLSIVACGITCALTGAIASAGEGKLIPFESLQVSQPVDQTVDGVSVAAQNDDQAQITAFDTTARQTARPQLEGPNGHDTHVWSEGNLLMDKKLGQVLTAHSETTSLGTVSIEFPAPIVSLGLDLVNVQNQGDDGSITFFKQGEKVGVVQFADLVDSESLFYDPTVKFSANSANRVQPLYADLLAVDEFDRIVIRLADGQAIDNLTYETARAPLPFGFQTLLQPNGFNGGFGSGGPQQTGTPGSIAQTFALAGGVGGPSGGGSGGGGGSTPPTNTPTTGGGSSPNSNPPIVPTPSAALAGLALLGYLGIRRSPKR